MAQVLEANGESLLKRALARPYLLFAAICVFVLAIPAFRQQQDWSSVYVPAAARLAHGEDIFLDGFVYPPINAWMALPFVSMPRVPAVLLWHAVNMVALMVLLVVAWRLSGGGRLDGLPKVPLREHGIFWLGLLCGIPSCIDAVTNQQTDLIVAALCILGCWAVVRERSVWGGVWFGVAAAIKCTPLLWAPYLAWRRRWGAALTVVVVAGAVNLIPDLTHPPTTGSSRLVEWGGRFLKPMAERKHEFGSWACGIGGNQSVAGIWQRWLDYDPVWAGNELVGQRSASAVAPETLKAATWSSMALLLAAAVVCTWRSRPAETQITQAPTNWALEFGLVLILMVMLSPHSSKPHFCTLVLPGFCVARAAMNWPNRRSLPVLCAALVFALLPNCDLVGDWIYSWAKWHASILWCALLLFAASCRVLMARCAAASSSVQDMRTQEAADLRQAA